MHFPAKAQHSRTLQHYEVRSADAVESTVFKPKIHIPLFLRSHSLLHSPIFLLKESLQTFQLSTMTTYSAPQRSTPIDKVSSLYSLPNGSPKSSTSSFHYKRSYDEMDGKAKVTLVEQEVLANTSHWQDSRNDMPQRRLILQQIMALAQPYGSLQNGSGSNNLTERQKRESLVTLAKRIELSLYSRAASLEEYQNLSTLRRRLQALISFSYHETAAINEQALSKRDSAKPSFFRNVPSFQAKRHCVLPLRSQETECMFCALDENSVRTIYSFLDGKEIIRVRAINRFTAKFAPTCITSLRVNVRSMAQSFTNGQTEFGAIPTLVNLRRLVIYKDNDPTLLDAQSNSRALRAWSCSELDASEDNIGEKVTHSLASAIGYGACERLHTLHLVALFTNTFHRNGLRALCGVLSQGKCPEIEDLLLGGNSIGDVGSLYVARVLHSKAIPKLQRLDLRRNYIGELGLKRLMSVVSAQSATQLKYLCLGGNIITDNCVSAFTSVLSSSACPQLRFLGLEDNYLSPEGVQTIIRSAVKSGMIPRLYKVGNENSS